MGKQEMVFKVQMNDSKMRTKALKLAVGLQGVVSATVDGEKIVVVGDEVDAVELVSLLRKKMGHAEIISVGQKKDKAAEGVKKSVQPVYQYPYQKVEAIEPQKEIDGFAALDDDEEEEEEEEQEVREQLLVEDEEQQEPLPQSQKRGDWDIFVRYVSLHQNPALTPEQYTADHVVEFLNYLHQQSFEGRKVIHLESCCPFYGHRNPPSLCPCPLPHSPALVEALISRLTRVFEAEGGRSESNPFPDGFERWKVQIGQIQAAQSGISLLSLSNDADDFEASYAQKIPSFPPRTIYGREEETEELIKLFLRSDSSTDDISVVLITGAAGIGKTTLAQIVYSDQRVHEHFSLRVWLSLPYQFDLIWLLQAILWCIEEPEGMRNGMSRFKPWLSKTTTESPAMDDILLSLVHDLSEKLAGERFLLVLDDFQMEDPLLLRTFRNRHLAAKIIVTARKESIASILQADELYHLKGLQEDKCWNLFQEKCCPTRDFANNKQLEYIGKQIISNCEGVPLAAKMLGSLLRDIQDEKIWSNVLRSMRGSIVTGDVLLRAVREAYECMPSHLKSCLAYCSAFPRDFKFKKDELVKLWVAEGLIQYCSAGKTLEDEGMDYFDDLQRRSHLKPCLAYSSAFPRDCKLEKGKLIKLWMAEGSQYSGSKTLEDIGTDMWRRSYFHCYDVDTFSLLDFVHDLSEKFKIARDLPQTSSRVDETIIYGRENDKWKVIKLLLSNDCKKRDISVIRIVASGGVGKTTLANLVYNDSTVCEIFETRLWISMNEKYDYKDLAKAVIESLTGIFCGLTGLMEIQEALRQELMGRRFLLVLDNVYSDHGRSFWSSLLVSLRTAAKGSIVIATTRDGELTEDLDTTHSYKLNRLSDSNCWLVFQQHAFMVRDRSVYPDLVEIGKQLANRLEGLPLAARALGGLLCLEQKEMWNFILKSEHWNPADKELSASGSINYELRMLQMQGERWGAGKTLPALRLSYNHLTVDMQWCFEYCSLFPKDHIFEKEHLVRLWMSSQGFIEQKEGKHEQDIGNEYFDELLKRSFFQRSPICDPKENKYVMHDHFHDLAQAVSASRCFRSETSKLSVIPEGVRHVSLVPSEFSAEVLFEGFSGPRDIQTLLLINRSIMKWDASLFHIKNPALLFHLLLHLTCLRTLDLSFTDIEVVPESISNLQHLCYLALNRTKIRNLPESICSLHELQTLELQGCNYLTELPTNIRNLSKLQHLLVWKESGFTFMPSGIGELTSLRTLSTFTVGRDGLHCRIRELKDLMNLRGALCIGGISNVVNGDDAKGAELKMKEHLTTLTLQWFSCGVDLEDDQSAETATEVLQSLQPHKNLEELTIRDYSGDQFPSWIADPSFLKLMSITLDNCYECDNLPPLGQLPSLKHLSIRMMDGVQRLGHEFCGSGPSRGFQSLQTLKLWDMPELIEWSLVEEEYFPCLRNLSISRCDKLRGLPCFPSLLELSIHCCAQLLDPPTLPSLMSLKIEGVQSLVYLPQLNLPALENLVISDCNQLFLVNSLSHLPSLKQLKVTRCPILNFPPSDKLPSTLQVIEIRGSCALLCNWNPDGFEEITIAQARRKFVRCKTTTKQGNSVDDFSTCQVVDSEMLSFGATGGELPTTLEITEERGVSFTEERFGILHEMITNWDSDPSMIWDRDPEEAARFLRVVGEICQFTEELREGQEELLCHAHCTLKLAMARLKDEFVHLLVQYRQPVKPELMSFRLTEGELSFRSTEDELIYDFSSSLSDEEPIQGKIQSESSRVSEEFVIELIHPDVIFELKTIAEMMFLSKYGKECCQAYIGVRRDALDECLSILQMERLSFEEVIQMDWCSLNPLIKRWNRALNFFVRVYLASERRLNDLIFGNRPESVRDYCFFEYTKGPILQLINLGRAIAIGPVKIEKLFRILDMYEGLTNLLINIKSLYPGGCGSSILVECHEVLFQLSASMRASFAEFNNAIRKNTSTTPFAGGGVHPLTMYVMNYLRAVADYSETLDLLLKSKDEKDCLSSPIAQHLQSVASILEANLETRSMLYADTALQNLYMMNNLCYMVQKVKDTDLRGILGDDWIRAYSRKFRMHAMNYERASWSSVLSFLKDEGVCNHGSNYPSKTILKERFKSFNLAFEEVYRAQTGWIVPNIELRDDLKISISLKVLQAYRTFTGRYASHLDVRHRDSYIKYCPEDLERCLLDLFEGLPKVMHPHKR